MMSRRLMEMPTNTRPSSAADAPTCANAKLSQSPGRYANGPPPRREKLSARDKTFVLLVELGEHDHVPVDVVDHEDPPAPRLVLGF
jgi:hypothetical protein